MLNILFSEFIIIEINLRVMKLIKKEVELMHP
jgi:hypothetical protein